MHERDPWIRMNALFKFLKSSIVKLPYFQSMLLIHEETCNPKPMHSDKTSEKDQWRIKSRSNPCNSYLLFGFHTSKKNKQNWTAHGDKFLLGQLMFPLQSKRFGMVKQQESLTPHFAKVMMPSSIMQGFATSTEIQEFIFAAEGQAWDINLLHHSCLISNHLLERDVHSPLGFYRQMSWYPAP